MGGTTVGNSPSSCSAIRFRRRQRTNSDSSVARLKNTPIIPPAIAPICEGSTLSEDLGSAEETGNVVRVDDWGGIDEGDEADEDSSGGASSALIIEH